MKSSMPLAAVAIAVLGLAACSPGFYGSAGYGVTLHDGDVITHAPGHADAVVSADGSLRIGNRGITLTPTQQASLKKYYEESMAIVADGKATGEAGAQLGHSVVGSLIKNIFSGNASNAGKAMTERADAVSAAAQKLCTDIQQAQRTQHAIAAQLPAFQPYANADRDHCEITRTTTVTATSNTAPGLVQGTTSASISSTIAALPSATGTANAGRQP